MNVKDNIQRFELRIKDLQLKVKWLRKHRKKLETLPEGNICGDNIDFDNLPHSDVIKVIRTLGGKWKKSPNYDSKERIDYVTHMADGMKVRCWKGEPPPSCRLVEVEEVIPEQVIPAQVRKVTKLICTGNHEPVAVAVSRAITNNQERTEESI